MNNKVATSSNLTLPSQHAHSTPLRTPPNPPATLWTPGSDIDRDTFAKEGPTLWQPPSVAASAPTRRAKMNDVAEKANEAASRAKAQSRGAWAFVKDTFAHACGVAMSIWSMAVGKVQNFFGLRGQSQQPTA